MAYIGNSPANTGNYQIVDDIASGFNGSATSFALASGGIAITPAKSGQLLASINGVLQEPDDSGSNGFKVSSSNIVFSSAPASGDVFWSVYQGQNVDIGTPSNDVVDTAHIKDNAITADKIAAGAVVADIATGGISTAKIADDAVTVDKLANSINTAIAANTAKTGISSAQTSAITANTAKTGITSSQANAITANTAKTGISSAQTSAITANTAKTGITSSQATAITAALPKAGGAMSGTITNFRSTGIDDNAAGATSITIDSNEGVGIKNTSSDSFAYKGLVVGDGGGSDQGVNIYSSGWGALAFADATSGNGRYEGSIAYNHATNSMAIATNHATAITITSAGNVGIGTSAPTFENGSGLEIRYAGGNGAHLKLTDNASGAGGTNGFDLYSFNTAAYIENYEAGAMVFRNNGAERMRITSDGKVGIGVTPSAALQVRTALSSVTQSTPETVLLLETTAGTGNMVAGNGTRILFKISDDETNPSVGASIDAVRENGDDSISSTALVLSTSQNDETLDEALRITSAGNVGIGTSAPDVLLDVGDSDHGSAGNAGIQIQNSQAFATVYGGDDVGKMAGIQTVNHDDTSNRTPTGIVFVHRSSSSGIAAIQSTSAAADRADLRFITRGSDGIAERVRIDEGGGLVVLAGLQIATGTVVNTGNSGGTLSMQGGATYPGGKIRMRGGQAGGDFKVYTGGSTSSPAEAFAIDSAGAVIMPKQPAFLAQPSTDQNNIAEGSDVTVVFGTEVFDQNSDFASNTFTAPVTGKYQLNIFLRLNNVDTAPAYYQFKIITSNRNYTTTYDTGGFSSDPVYYSFSQSALADMDAGDTAYIAIHQHSAGTAQTDVDPETTFSGFLAC